MCCAKRDSWMQQQQQQSISAEMTLLCSLASYLKSNRCGLIGMRSPPRGWQKSVTGSIPVGVGDCKNWFSFCLLFSRSFSLQLSCPFLYFALVKEKKTILPESLYATAMAEVIFWTICTTCTYILLGAAFSSPVLFTPFPRAFLLQDILTVAFEDTWSFSSMASLSWCSYQPTLVVALPWILCRFPSPLCWRGA